MDPITIAVPVHEEPHTTPTVTRPSPTERTLAVMATYGLSEYGRKISLLTGGDGRAMQQRLVHVPLNRLHLVSVDADGIARLRLRPRYERDATQQVVRIDAPPTYDTPPDLEGLFQDAARNHQLERAYDAERRAARATRRDSDRERRMHVAQAFLTEPERRAVVHPAPTPKRCYVGTDQGRVLFDVTTDEGAARDVPPEAHRRFRADLRARAEATQHERAAQLAVHEEKKRHIADWVTAHGTPEQQARQAAGMLPMDEVIEAMTNDAFAALRDRRRYLRDGVARLEAHLRRVSPDAAVVVAEHDVIITSTNAVKASAAQWAVLQDVQARMPEATVTLRVHKLGWTRNPRAPTLALFGVLVTQKVGPLTLRREYAVEE